MGQILEINLSNSEIKKTPLNEELAMKFLGGAGYACATLLPKLAKDTDPLGPDNILFFMTGALTGTLATSTGRMVVCAKSPLTGIWGECNCGSDVCVQIKKAGYDGILIKGAASNPKYLEISDDKVELKDASPLWGKGIYETTEILKSDPKFAKGRIISIGPAGENLVKFSNIGSEERAFGRTGMGAVMGSKKLKAIAVIGTKKIEIAEPDALRDLAKQANKSLMEVFTNQMMGELGTSGGLDMYNVNGELPVKYYRDPEFAEFDNISGATLSETFLKKTRHCFSCPIGCGRVVAVEDEVASQEKLPKGEFEGPEYETIAAFGSLMMNGDMLKIVKANYICNDLGFDTIEAGSIIACLMDNFEQGKISASDLDGDDLAWGDMDMVFKLLNKIARREGVGDLIANGIDAVKQKFSLESEQIAALHNSHVTLHDMRSSNGMALAYGISPHYGGSHNSCDAYMVSTGLEIADMDIISIPGKENNAEIAQMAAKVMDYRAFYSAAIFCVFANPSGEEIAKYLQYGLGVPFDKEKILDIGRRVHTLKRLFNLKMGHTPKDEKIPQILLTPLPTSGNEGNVPDVDLLYREFYAYQEWDPATGWPSEEKIKRLGLEDYAQLAK